MGYIKGVNPDRFIDGNIDSVYLIYTCIYLVNISMPYTFILLFYFSLNIFSLSNKRHNLKFHLCDNE